MSKVPTEPPPRIDIIEIATKKVIKSIRLSSANEGYVERVLVGLLCNLDTERFFAKEVLR